MQYIYLIRFTHVSIKQTYVQSREKKDNFKVLLGIILVLFNL